MMFRKVHIGPPRRKLADKLRLCFCMPLSLNQHRKHSCASEFCSQAVGVMLGQKSSTVRNCTNAKKYADSSWTHILHLIEWQRKWGLVRGYLIPSPTSAAILLGVKDGSGSSHLRPYVQQVTNGNDHSTPI